MLVRYNTIDEVDVWKIVVLVGVFFLSVDQAKKTGVAKAKPVDITI
jgi:hypothetical protein